MADNASLGTGLSTYPDLFQSDGRMRFVSGRRLLAESVARRLETSLGQMYWDPDAGFNLRSYTSETFDARTRLAIEVLSAAEAEKDERVYAVTADATFDAGTKTVRLTLTLTDAQGEFRFVLGVTPTSVDVLTVDE